MKKALTLIFLILLCFGSIKAQDYSVIGPTSIQSGEQATFEIVGNRISFDFNEWSLVNPGFSQYDPHAYPNENKITIAGGHCGTNQFIAFSYRLGGRKTMPILANVEFEVTKNDFGLHKAYSPNPGTLNLAWDPLPAYVESGVHYKIKDEDGTIVYSGTGNSLAINNLTECDTKSYQITLAFNTYYEYCWSDPVVMTVPTGAPANLSLNVTPQFNGSIRYSVSIPAGPAETYSLYRKVDGGSYSFIRYIDRTENQTTVVSANQTSNTCAKYYYKLTKASTPCWNGLVKSVVTTPPGSYSAYADGNQSGTFTVRWSTTGINESTYIDYWEVKRGSTTIATNIAASARSWIDNNPLSGCTHYYVRAKIKNCHSESTYFPYSNDVPWAGPSCRMAGYSSSEIILDGEDAEIEQIFIYPNPVKGNKIYFSAMENLKEVRMYDLKGNEVDISLSDNVITFPNISEGIYVIKLHTEISTITKQIVVQ